MKKRLVHMLALTLFLPVMGHAYGPSEDEMRRTTDRIEQKRSYDQHQKQMERERVRSQAERDMDKIPGSTTVEPMGGKGGGGVQVTIPNR